MRMIGKGGVVSVLGLSCSGTTIVNNIFDSMDNAFCISEPHWTLMTKPERARFGKLNGFSYSSTIEILPTIREIISEDGRFDFGGVKETFRPFRLDMLPVYESMLDNSDIMIFVFRDPKSVLNSMRSKDCPNVPVSFMVENYRKFSLMVREHTKPKVTISLEEMCANGNKGVIPYLNKRANGIFRIEGDFVLQPSDYAYGNHRAKTSRSVVPIRITVSKLRPSERLELDKTLGHLYLEGIR